MRLMIAFLRFELAEFIILRTILLELIDPSGRLLGETLEQSLAVLASTEATHIVVTVIVFAVDANVLDFARG